MENNILQLQESTPDWRILQETVRREEMITEINALPKYNNIL